MPFALVLLFNQVAFSFLFSISQREGSVCLLNPDEVWKPTPRLCYYPPPCEVSLKLSVLAPPSRLFFADVFLFHFSFPFESGEPLG